MIFIMAFASYLYHSDETLKTSQNSGPLGALLTAASGLLGAPLMALFDVAHGVDVAIRRGLVACRSSRTSHVAYLAVHVSN